MAIKTKEPLLVVFGCRKIGSKRRFKTMRAGSCPLVASERDAERIIADFGKAHPGYEFKVTQTFIPIHPPKDQKAIR